MMEEKTDKRMPAKSPDVGLQAALTILADVYQNRLPFNKVLGLRVDRLDVERVCLRFDMQAMLVGNYVFGVLHGGVISTALDAAGGLAATAGILPRLMDCPPAEVEAAIARIGTIDLRIDYLRPGTGRRFYATGAAMRTGRKVSVIRMEMHNEKKRLIAVGTGTYIVG